MSAQGSLPLEGLRLNTARWARACYVQARPSIIVMGIRVQPAEQIQGFRNSEIQLRARPADPESFKPGEEILEVL